MFIYSKEFLVRQIKEHKIVTKELKQEIKETEKNKYNLSVKWLNERLKYLNDTLETGIQEIEFYKKELNKI
jgi:hypothetical protein